MVELWLGKIQETYCLVTQVRSWFEEMNLMRRNWEQQPSCSESEPPARYVPYNMPSPSIPDSFRNTSMHSQLREANICDDLCEWAVGARVPHYHLWKLLNILRNHEGLQDLPADWRTLLGTCRTMERCEMVTGEYHHFGVGKQLFENSHLFPPEGEDVKFVFGIDKLPVSNSPSSRFWPILFYIRLYSSVVFIAMLYWGFEKPSNSNKFVEKLHSKLSDLYNYRFIIQDIHHNVICCNNPAKAFLR